MRQVITRQPVMMGNTKIGDKEVFVTQTITEVSLLILEDNLLFGFNSVFAKQSTALTSAIQYATSLIYRRTNYGDTRFSLFIWLCAE